MKNRSSQSSLVALGAETVIVCLFVCAHLRRAGVLSEWAKHTHTHTRTSARNDLKRLCGTMHRRTAPVFYVHVCVRVGTRFNSATNTHVTFFLVNREIERGQQGAKEANSKNGCLPPPPFWRTLRRKEVGKSPE